MMILSKEQILGVNDITIESVSVPQWGGDVCIRTLSGSERDKFELSLRDPRTGKTTNMADFRARYAAMVICDENGAAIFSASDVAALGKKSAKALDRIMERGQALNGMTEKDVDELVGESEDGQNADSGSV